MNTLVNQIMTEDLGGRGLQHSCPDLGRLTACLESAKRVLILTGFPVCSAAGNQLVGETDGPGGTAELAFALGKLGCCVTVATDAFCQAQVRAALDAVAPQTACITLQQEAGELGAVQLLEALRPDAVLALERPGRAADGHCHSMYGKILDEVLSDTDALFYQAQRMGIVTVGIGDGGNELGMGALRQQVIRKVPFGEQIAACQWADYTLTAGVSNWWGAGLAALLSRKTGRWLLLSAQEETAVLRAVIKAGGVDGCTGLPEESVDGLPLAVHLQRRAALEQLLRQERKEA